MGGAGEGGAVRKGLLSLWVGGALLGRGLQEGLRPETSSAGILAPHAMRKLLHPQTRQGS